MYIRICDKKKIRKLTLLSFWIQVMDNLLRLQYSISVLKVKFKFSKLCGHSLTIS